jgi:hypothetical protein
VENTGATAVSYAVAAGLFAAAGIFLISALLVGATAAFRWIELRYGLFYAFVALGGQLTIIAILCVALAIYGLKRPAKRIVPLASRLRVAISDPPSVDDLSPATAVASLRSSRARKRNEGVQKYALILAATLAGWAIMRRGQAHTAPALDANDPG